MLQGGEPRPDPRDPFLAGAAGRCHDPVVWGNGLDAYVQVAPLDARHPRRDRGLPGRIPSSSTSSPRSPTSIRSSSSGRPRRSRRCSCTSSTRTPTFRSTGTCSAPWRSCSPIRSPSAPRSHQPDLTFLPGLQGIADIGSIVGSILDPQGNETYEQLGCVGLNTTTSTLAATIDIKQSSGYSGSLCTSGSQEYVAFWADSGSGYEYVGTTSVNVHDLASIPAGGVQYSAALPFPQALTQRQPCTDGPDTVAIRAVLSWATPPSDTDPYAVPVWGGHLEATVLIPPGEPVVPGGGPDLESIGNMPIGLIDQGTGLATGQSLATFVASACPFGGVVNFSGHVINPSGGVGGTGLSYRILISTNGGVTSTPMTAPFYVETNNWITAVQTSVLADTRLIRLGHLPRELRREHRRGRQPARPMDDRRQRTAVGRHGGSSGRDAARPRHAHVDAHPARQHRPVPGHGGDHHRWRLVR